MCQSSADVAETTQGEAPWGVGEMRAVSEKVDGVRSLPSAAGDPTGDSDVYLPRQLRSHLWGPAVWSEPRHRPAFPWRVSRAGRLSPASQRN